MKSFSARVTTRLALTISLSLIFLGVAAADLPGKRLPGSTGIRQTTRSIMARQAASPPPKEHPDHELEYPNRDKLPQNPLAPAVSRFPAADAEKERALPELEPKIHTTSLAFDGATLTDTGAFPPDSMGTVGPTQFIVFVNGRIRSFTNATCTTTAPNRWMVAVSDAASNGTISGSTVWTFFQFQPDPGTSFLDYPSLGIDVNALYTGGTIFTSAGSFVGTNGYVIQKASILGAGPMVVTSFPNLAAITSTPARPRDTSSAPTTRPSASFSSDGSATRDR
jgi:hypothetical protein